MAGEGDQRERLAERLIESLGVIMRIRGNAFRRAVGKHGVTLPQFFLLKMVNVHGEMTVTQASQVMMVAAPTASRMIDNLCEKGWLERWKDPENRRLTRVRLTREGREILAELGEMQKEEFLKLIDDHDLREIESFLGWLERFTARLSAALEGESDRG
ncbi:MAG: MarR family transcriptional regulator [Actinobacteria bacterium]|nr:MarR family transcriptional regulator [Actinomycetota bacterium]